MRAIHGAGTLPERVVRKWLYANGWRFRCQYKRVPGHPDVAMPKIRTLIEIRGCFWHHHGWEWNGRKLVQTAACPQATAPKSNRAFWNAKFRANVRRDQEHERIWRKAGWNVIVIWECALKTEKERAKTFRWLGKRLADLAGTHPVE